MDVVVPEGDGTKIAIAGETLLTIEADGDLAIVDADKILTIS